MYSGLNSVNRKIFPKCMSQFCQVARQWIVSIYLLWFRPHMPQGCNSWYQSPLYSMINKDSTKTMGWFVLLASEWYTLSPWKDYHSPAPRRCLEGKRSQFFVKGRRLVHCKMFTRVFDCLLTSRVDRHTSCEWKCISWYGNSRVCHSDWIEEAGHEQSLKGCSVLVSVPTASLLRKGTGFLVRKPLVTIEKSRETLQ